MEDWFDDTFNEKFPSRSVIVPFDVPFSMMLAPITGSPFISTTLPVILFLLSLRTGSFVVSIMLLSRMEYWISVSVKSCFKTLKILLLFAVIDTLRFKSN